MKLGAANAQPWPLPAQLKGHHCALTDGCLAEAACRRDEEALGMPRRSPLPPLIVGNAVRTSDTAFHGTSRKRSPVHVTALSGRKPVRRGVVGHETWIPVEVGFVMGLPVIAAADAWCQSAALLHREDLVAAGDFLLTPSRKGARPITGLEQLRAAAARYGDGRGARSVRWALERVRVGPLSRPESLLRLALTAAGLPEPLVAHPVPVAGGLVLHPDLVYPQWRLVIEYEGDHHRADRRQWRDDLTRYELLQDAGWRVIRVHADDLAEGFASVIRRVRSLANA